MDPLDDVDVVVVGAGATGSRMLAELAGTGARVTCVDRDVLERKNLETCPAYPAARVGEPKAAAAEAVFGVDGVVADVDARSIRGLLGEADVVLDGTDNLETRFLIDEYAHEEAVPWVHTAALGERGVVLPFPGTGACFRCVFGHVDAARLASCETAGVDHATADRVAREAVAAARDLVRGDADQEMVRVFPEGTERLAVAHRADCETCAGARPHLDRERRTRVTAVCGPDTYQVNPHLEGGIDLVEVAENAPDGSKVEKNEHLVRVGGVAGYTVFRDGRMLVRADSAAEARAVHARVVGH